MSASISTVLYIVGAQSRSGRAIAQSMGARPVIGVSRAATSDHEIEVADYAQAVPGSIPPEATVVNCAGSIKGSESELRKANVEVAVAWAQAAKRAGAARFIQLSSFSIYGTAEHVGTGTPARPADAYGRTKLAAEQALSALSGPGFSVTFLRVPMLFGRSGKDKLRSLVFAVARTKIVPYPLFPVARSMLSYSALGEIVARIENESLDGVRHAADAVPFTYDLLAGAARRSGIEPWRMRIPAFASNVAGIFAPRTCARLLGSSLLAAEDNLAQAFPSELSSVLDGRFAEASR